MTEKLVSRALTLDEMLAIKDAVFRAATPVEALIAALKTTFGMLLADLGQTWDEVESITPWAFAIPASQWAEIGEWLMEAVDRTPNLEKVNVLLDWMNKGPSGEATLDVGAASLKD